MTSCTAMIIRPPSPRLLAEAVALTAMLGAMLKFDGKFILQTKTDGPVDMIVADYVSPGRIRGYARFDAARVAALENPAQPALLGNGYLAMTVDQGPDMERYQGIVPLDGAGPDGGGPRLFREVRADPHPHPPGGGPAPAARRQGPRAGGPAPSWCSTCRARAAPARFPPIPAMRPEGMDEAPQENDDWVKARLLLDTVEAHELLDPQLSAEQLLYRLYHEDGVTAYPATPLARYCSCSQDSITRMLARFPAEDQADMVRMARSPSPANSAPPPTTWQPGEIAPLTARSVAFPQNLSKL